MNYKKHLKGFFIIVFLIIVLFLSMQEESRIFISNAFVDNTNFTEGNFINKCALDTEHLSIKLLSIQEMASNFGGCSGGNCEDYPHICSSGCEHLNAEQCYGTYGSCVNTGYAPVCRCDGSYDFIEGCE